MKGKLLQKTTALILVLCMTMVNFLFVATNVVYALSVSEVSIESGKITFDAYFKDKDGNKVYTKEANISEGATLYAKIKLQSGVLKDAKIKIDNANFKLPESISSKYVVGIDNATKEIKLKELNGSYDNDIDLEIPVAFEKQSTIGVDYFDKDNTVSLSGEYKASETFKTVTAQIGTHLNWTEVPEKSGAHIAYAVEKTIKDEKRILVQERVAVSAGSLPRVEDKLNIKVPKINDKEPDTINLLINGKKLEQNLKTNNYNIKTGELEYTNSFVKDNQINWGTGTDIYKVIYIFENVENIDSVKNITRDVNAVKVTSKVFQYEKSSMEMTCPKEARQFNFNNGNIVSVDAQSKSKNVYKGFMYANSSNGTTYKENYNIEVSDISGISKVELKSDGDKFKAGEANIDTNNQTLYKKVSVDWDKASQILGSEGTIKITDGNGTVKEINASTEKEVALNAHNITVATSAPIKEGQLTISATKQIVGDAGLSKEAIQSLTAIETTVKATTNKDNNGSAAVATTEFKEPITEASLTMQNNTNNTTKTFLTNSENKVEFIATLKTGTEDTYLFKKPTIKIELPEDVTEIKNVTANALFAEDELTVTKAEAREENGKKLIYIEVDGSQKEFTNKVTEGIKVTINADVVLNQYATSKDGTVTMTYTNENAASHPEPVAMKVSIESPNKVLTNTKVTSDGKEGVMNFATTLSNLLDKDIENIAIISQIPSNTKSQAEFEKQIKATLKSSIEASEVKVQYSADKKTWTDTAKNVKYYKIVLDGSKLTVGQTGEIKYTLNNVKELSNFELAYTADGKEEVTNLDLNLNESNFVGEKADVTPVNEVSAKGVEQQTENLNIKMTAISGGKELKDGDEILAGQSVVYKYQITNKSGKDLNNVKISLNAQGANIFGEYTYQAQEAYQTDKMKDFTILAELDNKSKQTITVKTLKNGDTTKEYTCQVIVKEDAKNLKTDLDVSADNLDAEKITIANSVIDSELKLLLTNNINRDYPLIAGNYASNKLEVKNLTNKDLSDITLKMDLPEGLKLVEIDKSVKIVEKDDNSFTIKVDELKANATKKITIKDRIMKNTDSNINIQYIGKINDKKYYSNIMELITQKVNTSNIEIKQTSNIDGKTVKNGDKLTYSFEIKNNESDAKTVTISDIVPEAAVVNKITYTQNNKETEIKDVTVNSVDRTLLVNAGETANVKIETEINDSKTKEDKIVNTASIKGNYFNVTSNPIEYIIERAQQPNTDPVNPDPNVDPVTPNPTDDPQSIPGVVTTKNSISGMTWLDENKNGVREASEKPLSGVTVMLANTKTGKYVTGENGSKLEVKTNSNGIYTFENIEEGKYIVVFTYDSLKYRNTEYKVSSATDSTNSDIITTQINVDNNETKQGVTDTLELKDKSLEHIDAGFIENEIFDLKLNKYISKVTVQNSSGTVVKQYNKEQLAKVEIDAKLLASSTVLVEYTLEVKNEGELAGYANEIVDYMPKEMSFSSEINKDWYKSTDGNVHTTALAKEIINPGETKQVVLTLTKAMTENNTGVTTNKAEITKSSNELSIPDKDTEDNSSTAEVIVSIRTGIEFTIGIIIAIIAITTTGIVVYTKKRKEAKNHE